MESHNHESRTCDEVRRLFPDHFHGVLDPAETDALLAHVEQCAECRGEFQNWEKEERSLRVFFQRDLRRAESAPNPLAEEAGARKRPPAARRFFSRLAAVAALLAVVFAGGAALYNYYRSVIPTGSSVVATLETLDGAGAVVQDGHEVSVLAVGDSLRQGQSVKVAADGYARLRLSAGGSLELQGGTKVQLLSYPDRLEAQLMQGRVWADLVDAQASRPVVIQTAHLAATVDNDLCGVEEGLGRSAVSVAAGSADIVSAGARHRLGEGQTFSSARAPESEPTPVADDWVHMPSARLAALAPVSAPSGPQRTRPLLRVDTAPQEKRGKGSTSPGARGGDEAAAAILPEEALVSSSATEPGRLSFQPSDASTPEATVLQTTDESTAPSVGTPDGEAPLGLVTAASTAESEPTTAPPENLMDFLPANTIYFAALDDLGYVREEFARTSYAELWNNASVQAWWEAMKEQGALGDALGDEHSARVFELLHVLEGQAVIAVVEGGAPLMLLDGSAASEEVRGLLMEMLENSIGDPVAPDDLATGLFDGRLWYIRDTLGFSPSTDTSQEMFRALWDNTPTGFRTGNFYQRVSADVDRPRFLMAANLSRQIDLLLASDAIGPEGRARLDFLGLTGVDYAVVSPTFVGQGINQAARLAFREEGRYGAMDWLAEPAPMRALRFFSPDVAVFSSTITRKPQRAILDMLALLESTGEETGFQDLLTFAARHDAFFEAFGGEVAVALDNPILPIPNVKIAIEIIDPEGFEAGFEQVLNDWRAHAERAGCMTLIEDTPHKDFIVHTLLVDGLPWQPSWAVIDDYCLLGPGPEFVRNSIDVYLSGLSIANDSRLTGLLPTETEMNFSFLGFRDIVHAIPAFIRQRIAPALDPAIERILPDLGMLENYSAPGIAYAYARTDCVDFYMNAPSGIDTNLGMVLPMVANWLVPRTSIGRTVTGIAQAEVDLQMIRQAALTYASETGRFPEAMSDLVGGVDPLLASVPLDPFGVLQGDTYRFAKEPGGEGILVYSIGPDQRDDGGLVEFDLAGAHDGPGDIVWLVTMPEDAPASGATP